MKIRKTEKQIKEIAMTTYANKIGYSDIEPFEVVEKITEARMVIRGMKADPGKDTTLEWINGGFAGRCTNQNQQTWEIASDLTAPAITVRLHKTGLWRDRNGNRYQISDQPIKFYDYNF